MRRGYCQCSFSASWCCRSNAVIARHSPIIERSLKTTTKLTCRGRPPRLSLVGEVLVPMTISAFSPMTRIISIYGQQTARPWSWAAFSGSPVSNDFLPVPGRFTASMGPYCRNFISSFVFVNVYICHLGIMGYRSQTSGDIPDLYLRKVNCLVYRDFNYRSWVKQWSMGLRKMKVAAPPPVILPPDLVVPEPLDRFQCTRVLFFFFYSFLISSKTVLKQSSEVFPATVKACAPL